MLHGDGATLLVVLAAVLGALVVGVGLALSDHCARGVPLDWLPVGEGFEPND